MKLLILGSGSYKSSLTYFRPVALGQQLAQLDWDVSLIVPSADKYNHFKRDKHAHLEHIDVVQPWHPATKSQILNLLPYLFTATWSILRRPTQAIYISKPTPLTIIGLIPQVLFSTPVILDLDDLGSKVMKAEGQNKWQFKLVDWCERLILKRADAVVVASSYLKKMVESAYPEKRVLLISNGVDANQFTPASGLKPRSAIYYFGALNRLELIDTLLEAMPGVLAKVPETQLTIFGGGKAFAAARNRVKELGISSNVTFTGWTTIEAVNQQVRFGDLAVCAQPDIETVQAASNLKVFQYMAMSSVPVVSKVGDLADYVRGGKTTPSGVAVAPEDPAALTVALVQLLNHPTKRTAMAKRARHQAETIYEWQTLAEKLDEFIRPMTKQPLRHSSQEATQ
jgi:glycosyltransferase involved in cell wall biosynthesis